MPTEETLLLTSKKRKKRRQSSSSSEDGSERHQSKTSATCTVSGCRNPMAGCPDLVRLGVCWLHGANQTAEVMEEKKDAELMEKTKHLTRGAEQLRAENEQFNDENELKDKDIIERQRGGSKSLNDDIIRLKNERDQLQKDGATKDDEIRKLDHKLQESGACIDRLETACAEKDKEIEALKQQVSKRMSQVGELTIENTALVAKLEPTAADLWDNKRTLLRSDSKVSAHEREDGVTEDYMANGTSKEDVGAEDVEQWVGNDDKRGKKRKDEGSVTEEGKSVAKKQRVDNGVSKEDVEGEDVEEGPGNDFDNDDSNIEGEVRDETAAAARAEEGKSTSPAEAAGAKVCPAQQIHLVINEKGQIEEAPNLAVDEGPGEECNQNASDTKESGSTKPSERGASLHQTHMLCNCNNVNWLHRMTDACKICSHKGCLLAAQTGDFCIRHGAKKRKTCSHSGCTNQAQKGGVCWMHGAKIKNAKSLVINEKGQVEEAPNLAADAKEAAQPRNAELACNVPRDSEVSPEEASSGEGPGEECNQNASDANESGSMKPSERGTSLHQTHTLCNCNNVNWLHRMTDACKICIHESCLFAAQTGDFCIRHGGAKKRKTWLVRNSLCTP